MKISAPAFFSVILLAVLAAGGFVYFQSSQAVEAPAVVADNTPHATEESWSAGQIAQFIGDLGALACGQKGDAVTVQPTKEEGVYDFSGSPGHVAVDVRKGVWDPHTYAAWARASLHGKTPPASAPGASASDCAKTLLDPSSSTLLAENARISRLLQDNPLSAEAHVQAALLIGAFALNEEGKMFRDVRPALNRLTAHLALADALGASPDEPGRRLAELIRLTLVGDQAEALAKLDGLPGDPSFASWREALRLRNTGDWRTGREAALAGPPLLQHEYFRALVQSINADAGRQFLDEAKVTDDPAFAHIANNYNLSVEDGHFFTSPLLDQDLKAIKTAAEAFGLTGQASWLIDYLNTPPSSPVRWDEKGQPTIQVAGRDFWAASQQRTLCEAINNLDVFLQDRYGVPEYADKIHDFFNGKLSQLRLAPFIQRLFLRDESKFADATVPCVAIIKAQPELVTPALWAMLDHRPDGGGYGFDVPDFHPWFHPEVPTGTVFDVGTRLYDIGVGDENDPVWLKHLLDLAPNSLALADQNANIENGHTFENMSPRVAEQWLGGLAAYNVRAMLDLADAYRDQIDLYRETMLKAAALVPDDYILLGDTLREKGRPDQAAEAYLLAFDKAQDRVYMANSSRWIVQFLFEKGNVDKAKEIAADAAKVYSSRGLSTQVWLFEKLGLWDDALSTAADIDERYEKGPVNVVGCLLRRQQIAPQSVITHSEEPLTKLFPDGIKLVKFEDFSAPVSGAQFTGPGKALERFGLRSGYVVVALDGVRTETMAQYFAVRAATDDAHMRMIVWDGKAFRALEGDCEGRRFGVPMADYIPPK